MPVLTDRPKRGSVDACRCRTPQDVCARCNYQGKYHQHDMDKCPIHTGTPLVGSPGWVPCQQCGRCWPRDPALEVVCPTCDAQVGHICRRPSGHELFGIDRVHIPRDQLALDQGKFGPCAGQHGPEAFGVSDDMIADMQEELNAGT